MYAEQLAPHSIEAEEAILGSVLINSDCLDGLIGRLTAADFYREKNGLVWAAFEDLYRQRVAVDQVTALNQLQANGKIEATGGMAYLSHLVGITPTSVHAEYYASVVLEKAKLRQIIATCGGLVADAYDSGSSIEIAQRGVSQLLRLRNGQEDRRPKSLRELHSEFQSELVDEFQGSIELARGTPTGFGDLDKMINGWEQGQLYVLGARTSMGKTLLANAFALNLARRGKPVFIFSLETSRRVLLERLIQTCARVDGFAMRQLPAGSPERERLSGLLLDALSNLDEIPITVDDRRGLKPVDMRATLLAHSKMFGTPALVIVDYLNLVRPERAHRSSYEAVSQNITELKDLGGEAEVPLLVLAQLNRAPEARVQESKKPTMADFRDAGTIEERASCLMALYRHSYYYKDASAWKQEYPDLPYPEKEMELRILKQQEGPTGTVRFFCDVTTGFVGDLLQATLRGAKDPDRQPEPRLRTAAG